MRVAVLTALATVSLLGACRQSETPANNSAASNETAAATASSNSTTPAAAPVTAERAQEIFHTRHEGMEDIGKKLVKGGAFIDVKAAFDAKALADAGYRLWRL